MSDWSSDVRPSYLLPPAPRRRRSRRSRGGRLRRPGAPSRRPGAGDSEFTRRSSPEGRARTKPSGRPEQPIAGVAEAGDDVGAVVEALVERRGHHARSEEHTSELQTIMRTSNAVFCWKNKKTRTEAQEHDIQTHQPIIE